MDTDSSEDDEPMEQACNKATAEERAFLQSIDTEELDQKEAADKMDDKSN